MKRIILGVLAALAVAAPRPARADIPNGGFETGGFKGWNADANWVVVDNGCGYYSGWAGKHWAWSGGKGEPALGKLTSLPFVMDRDAVRLLISGWSSIHGTGQPRRWNYVTLNLAADGAEIDRVYAPDTTVFVAAFLDGSRHRGERVYVQAVDDADLPTYSMLCIDDVRTADFPPDHLRPVPAPAPTDLRRTITLEDDRIAITADRATGSITRIRSKQDELDLILEPRLAGSFRFSFPIPGREPWQTLEANWIKGTDQKLSSARIEGRKLILRWDGPLRDYLGEAYKAAATMTVELHDGGALFSLTIENRTPYAVGETYFPVIGGLRGLGRTFGQLKATELGRPAGASPAVAALTTATIFRVFNNMSWLGDQGPEQFYASPETQPEPWAALIAPALRRSVLIGAPGAGRPLFLRLELIPASSGTPRDDGNWPRPAELKGAPVGVELSFVDTVGGARSRHYEAAPVFVRFVEGGAEAVLPAWRAVHTAR